jgi:hypothetical protein
VKHKASTCRLQKVNGMKVNEGKDVSSTGYVQSAEVTGLARQYILDEPPAAVAREKDT